jgi:hypothetical protein
MKQPTFQQVSLDQAIDMVNAESEPQLLPPTEVALTVPQEVTSIAKGSDGILIAAQEYTVSSEVEFQFADSIQAQLKAEAKQINDKRMEFTRPLDALKEQWMDFFRPAINARNQAVTIYQQKLSAYRAEERRKAEAAQREAERLLREDRERKEAEARKLEERAAKLKTPAAAEKLMNQADEIRQVAAMMPGSVALAASEPKTVASNVAEIWDVEKIEDLPAYLRWLADHPEWHGVLDFKAAEHKRLAKQFHAIGVPGLKFGKRDSFRSKAR